MKTIIISTTNATTPLVLTEAGEYEIRLVAPHAAVRIWCGPSVSAKESLAISVRVVHAAPHTSSQTILRAAVAGHVRLNGTVVIQPAANHSTAFLEEKVLLLAATAQAQTQPDLEIHNDNVHCTHAVAVGPIPPEQLFYLQSRGLAAAAATQVIVNGFLTNPLLLSLGR